MNFEHTDVVFVIEKSRSLKRYLPELVESYINPIVSYFSGGICEDSDVFFTQSSLVQYAIVFFGSELSLLGSTRQLESQGPTTSHASVLNAINSANYCHCNTNRKAYIYEGLHAAVDVFKQLSEERAQSENVKKCLVLVTQSSPIHHPWAFNSAENIYQELKLNGVKTSIISAHKMVDLYRLFESTGGDQQSVTLKNYAAKAQHLVLLNGFSLQERALSPSLMTQPNTVTVSTPPQMTVPSSNMLNRPAAASPGQNNIGSPANIPQQPNMTRPSIMLPNGQPSPMMSQPQVGAIGRAPGQMIMNPRQRWPMNSGTMMPQNPQQIQMAGGIQGSMHMGNTVPMNPPMSHWGGGLHTAWQGTLEWSEKKNGGGGTIQRIPCKISLSPGPNRKNDLKIDQWPSTLQLMLIEKALLGSIGNNYFQNTQRIFFQPEPCPALESLSQHLSSLGYAGCIHLSSNNTDVKMIVMIFSPEKNAYVGFIPHEQVSFVSKIKQMLQARSMQQQQQTLKQPGGLIQNVPGNQGVGQTQNIQMINNPGMNVSQSNMMMPNSMNQQTMTQGIANNVMVSGQVSQVGSTQMNTTQMNNFNQPTMGAAGHNNQVNMGVHVSQGVQMPNQMGPSPILANQLIRNSVNINQQQQPMQQGRQVQFQQRPIQLNVNQTPRMMQSQMQNSGMRQLMQQRFQHSQQQQQQQQQMLVMQQQGMRPQMAQTQQVMGQQVMNQQTMGQQGMAQQTMGQSMQETPAEFM